MQVVHRYEKGDPNFGWEFEDWNFNTVFKASSKEETKLKLSVLGYRLLSGVRYESSGYTIYDVSAETQGARKRRPWRLRPAGKPGVPACARRRQAGGGYGVPFEAEAVGLVLRRRIAKA